MGGNEESEGQGSCGLGGVVVICGSETRTFEANVSGREAAASSGVGSAMVGTDGAAGAKGLEEVDDDENGLADVLVEDWAEKWFAKGFAEDDPLEPFATPNSEAPICGCGFGSGAGSFFSIFVPDLADAPFAIRTPRIPLTLPSFLLHALRRQLQMYNRRSCPGKCSGRSPLSSRRRLRRPLHTLHFASAPDGAVFSSSQLGAPPTWEIESPVASLVA